MKKTKIIIPALGMLLLGTAASVTSTVAWFAMNSSVSATGMQIKAKSESVFLLIGSGDVDTLSEIQTANSTTTALTVAAGDAAVYPSAHDSIANTAAATSTEVSNLKQYYLTSDNSQKITIDAYNALDAEDKALYTAENANGTNWYYRVADAVTASTSTKQKNYLATIDANYIIHKVCYVTLAEGSPAASNLKVTNAAFTTNGTSSELEATFAAVKVLVTSSTAAVELDSANPSSNTALAASVTNDAVIQLDIFLYYDGNHTSVYTNNMANLDGANVSLTFGVN